MKVDSSTLLNILTAGNKAVGKLLDLGENTAQNLIKNPSSSPIASLLSELFEGLVSGDKNKTQIESMLKNTQFFKSLGSFADNLKTLFNMLKNESSLPQNLQAQLGIIENTLQNIEGMDEKKLKEFIKNSGIFLENKLLHNDVQIKKDLKGVLLGIQNELKNETITKEVEKVLIQIDYYQLLSLVSDANFIYLPLDWEEFENGKMGFKQIEEKTIYCEIDLMLKSYDALKIKLLMQDNEYLHIVFEAKNETFFKDAKESISQLKLALHKLGLVNTVEFKKSDDTLAKVFEQSDYIGHGVEINV